MQAKEYIGAHLSINNAKQRKKSNSPVNAKIESKTSGKTHKGRVGATNCL